MAALLRRIVGERNISVMRLEGGYSQGTIAADLAEFMDDGRPGCWWLARLLVQPECRQRGLGTELVKGLQEELLGHPNFQVIVVAPGGYNSDPDRLFAFYRRQGFVDREDGALEWRKP